jgi:hypothetical protein
MRPAGPLASLARVTKQQLNLGRAEITSINVMANDARLMMRALQAFCHAVDINTDHAL